MASFTDQKPRTATEADLLAPWSGHPRNFRCYLCGHRFKVGDVWRWVFSDGRRVMNFLTCEKCDGPDVLDRFADEVKRVKDSFWWMDR
jgi:hypothetical protein